MDPLLAYLALQAGRGVHGAQMLSDLSQTEPVKDSALGSAKQYHQARADLLKEAGLQPRPIKYVDNAPKETDSFYEKALKVASFGSHDHLYPPDASGNADVTKTPLGAQININPNTHSEILAHELGHDISAQKPLGKRVRKMRELGPVAGNHALKRAVAMGMGLTPLINSSLQEGDDDLAIGLALAGVGAAPTLVDEALATKEGLAVMKKAGKPADFGQRSRLAGAYLTYLGAPIAAALGGHVVGNYLDDYTAVYDI